MGTQLKLFGFEPELKIVSSFDRNPIVAFEYLFLISPGAKVKQQVKELKQKLHDKIGLAEENLLSVPHISLLLLRENSNRDLYIIEKANEALANIDDLNILVKGMHVFEHTYTADLVLKIENNISELQASLSRAFQMRVPKSFIPHITLGRGIPKNRFEKLGPELREFDLREDFLCSSISILKRKVEITANETKRSAYQKIHEARLNNGIRAKENMLRTA